ncbi:MAG: LAGLIDADG family homing endonuclease [Candidatus Woesearchaeota archaeon]
MTQEKKTMSPEEQINKFQEFLELQYKDKLIERATKGEESLIIDFPQLAVFYPELAETLLEEPEEIMRAAEYAIQKFDLGIDYDMKVRFKELPHSSNILISKIRSKHIGKFIEFKGVVRQKTDVRPQVTSAKFECPSCGNIIPVLQVDTKFKEPGSCSCGRKGKFHMLSKELVDAQKLVLEEASEDLDGGEQPKRINIFLKNDLVSPISEKKTNPGSKITITGILKEVPITLATGGKSTRYDLMIEANYVEPVQEEFTSLELTQEQKDTIIELSKQPKIYEKIVKDIAPTIYGHDRIKEALVLQLFGGARKSQDDGVTRRGDIHILLIGDPGSGKCVSADTQILTSTGEIRTIKDIIEKKDVEHLPSIQQTAKTGFSQVTKFWERKEKNITILKTTSGRELKLTKDHPLFTTNNGFITSIEVKNLKKGDFIAIPRKTDVLGTLQKLNTQIINTTRNYKAPSYLTKDLALLLGLLCGDGHIKKSKTSAGISFTNKNKEVMDKYNNLFERIFKEKTTKSLHESYVTSRTLLKFFENNFEEIVNKSIKKQIPKKIQKSPDYIVAKFIQGLFESDAHINLNKRQIEYSTGSKELAGQTMMMLLRFGIVARYKEKKKTYKNSKYDSYELIIGADFTKKFAKIGFLSKNKQDKLNQIKGSLNTNTDVIPNIGDMLKTIRKELNLTQSQMGIGRSTYCHYEQKNRNPSRNTLKKIYYYLNKKYDTPFLNILKTITSTDIFWDKVKSIETKEYDDYVYDFEIQGTHNFIANGVMIHNSQLLKRMSHVAPKSRFVSGKGASGAGLCVSPKSLLMTNPGGLSKIKQVVEDNLTTKEEFRQGVWKQDNIKNIKIQSMNSDLKLQSKHPKSIWKLQAPEYMYEVTLETGKKIELTANTKLFKENLSWEKAKNLKEGDLIATPKKTIPGKQDKLYFVDLIKSNPHIHGVEEFIGQCKELIKNKEGIRKTSKKLGLNENYLYHNWINKETKGKIKLKDLKKLGEYTGLPWKEYVETISLYNGKKFNIPKLLDEEFLYVLGLLKGDGDLRENNSTFSIRLSNKEENILKHFKKFLEKNKLNYDESKQSTKRPKAIRFANKIYGEVIQNLGMPTSPKSEKIDIPETILHLNNKLVSNYIAGLIDTDGGVYVRTTKGSDAIEFNTCSKNLVEKLQLVLLRYGVKSYLRERKPSIGKIKGKLTKYILTIYSENIDKFFENIKLRHPQKRKNLEKIYKSKKRVVKNTKKDISFEKIKNIRKIKSKYSYVYDLTVEDSHNFVVNGVLVHNTASVVKDEFLRGWALEAGALVLANKGLVCIDELDKMTKEDASAMHEALEQQSITISKANIQATLRSETTVLAAANPKFGRFDPYEVLAKQIDLPSTLINRFDLIFPVKDLPNVEKDEKLASFILNLHRKSTEKTATELDTDAIKRYVAYAKQKINPKLTDESLNEIKDYFVKMRNQGSPEEKFQSIPISARQLEGLIRLSEASARTRLSPIVTRKDAQRAIDLLHHCLELIGYDSETGKFDIDRITTGITASQRSHIAIIKDIISEVESKTGKLIPIEEVVKEGELRGVSEDKANEVIDKLKRSGDLFTPKHGFISRV